MPKYNVTFVKTISLSIEVEADDEEAAIDEAYQQAPSLCAGCAGWGQKWGVDDSSEWMTLEDFHGEGYDASLDGATVEVAQ
jgi:hypothetical protein